MIFSLKAHCFTGRVRVDFKSVTKEGNGLRTAQIDPFLFMQKLYVRWVALILVPCLVADPCLAVLASPEQPTIQRTVLLQSRRQPVSCFSEEALAPTLEWAHNSRGHSFQTRQAVGRSKSLPRESAWGAGHTLAFALPLLLSTLHYHVASLPFIALAPLYAVWFLQSGILHENGHVGVASLFRDIEVDRSRLSLSPFAHLGGDGTLFKPISIVAPDNSSRTHRAAYLSAGPGVNLALALLAIGVSYLTGLTLYNNLAWINFALAAANFFPGTLRRGGQVLFLDGMQIVNLWKSSLADSISIKVPFLGYIAGTCPPMRIAYQMRLFDVAFKKNRPGLSEEELDKQRFKLGQALNTALTDYAQLLKEEADRQTNVRTDADPNRMRESANHAIQDAFGAALQAGDFSEAAFKQRVTDRLIAQLRGKENGGLSEDSEETVRSLIQTLEGRGISIADIAWKWQADFQIVDALRTMTREEIHALVHDAEEHERAHAPGLPHSHAAEDPSGRAHVVTPLELLGSLLRTVARLFALTTQSSPDTYAWLQQQVPTLTNEEVQFLRSVTNDKELRTDRPLVEDAEALQAIVSTLNVPHGLKNSVLLVGKKGVGKTSHVRILQQKINQGLLTGPIGNRRFLILTARFRPTSPDDHLRLARLIDILAKTEGRIMLFIDEVHSLTQGVNNTTDFSLANMLKPVMEDGSVTLVGASTLVERDRYIAKDGAYLDRWREIEIAEPSAETTTSILEGYRSYFEKQFGIDIAPEAIPLIVELTRRFIPDGSFPRKAVDTLQEVTAGASNEYNSLTLRMSAMLQSLVERSKRYIEMAKGGEEQGTEGINLYNQILLLAADLKELEKEREAMTAQRVTADRVRNHIAEETGADAKTLGSDEARRYLDMEKTLGERIVGQDQAVVAVAEAMLRAKAGMKEEKRPVGLLFVGPTGAGKTEVARQLAAFEFGDPKNAVVRLDMSEYQEKHTVSRLIGAPPGYVGYEEGGQLTEPLKHRRKSLVLMDEIEKAHPDVLNVLLQVLEDGRLTDGKGETVDFSDSIIIWTSNLGMGSIQGQLRALRQQLKETSDPQRMQEIIQTMNQLIANAVQAAFDAGAMRPELLNRVDAIIIFNVLTPEVMEEIARIQLEQELNARLSKQGYTLRADPAVIKFLAEEGYDPLMGARPLKRLIDKRVAGPISRFILEAHDQQKGLHGGMIHLKMVQNEIHFEIEEKNLDVPRRLTPTEDVAPLAALLESIIESERTEADPAEIAGALSLKIAMPAAAPVRYGPAELRTALSFTPQNTQLTFYGRSERKDGGAAKALEAVQRQADASPQKETIGPVVDQWFHYFVRLAKRNTDGRNVRIEWAQEPDGRFRIAVDQGNRISVELMEALEHSLSPEAASLDDVDKLQFRDPVIDRPLIELKMNAAKIEGVRFGAEGSRYWIEVPLSGVSAPIQRAADTAPGQKTPQMADVRSIPLTVTRRSADATAAEPEQPPAQAVASQQAAEETLRSLRAWYPGVYNFAISADGKYLAVAGLKKYQYVDEHRLFIFDRQPKIIIGREKDIVPGVGRLIPESRLICI